MEAFIYFADGWIAGGRVIQNTVSPFKLKERGMAIAPMG